MWGACGKIFFFPLFKILLFKIGPLSYFDITLEYSSHSLKHIYVTLSPILIEVLLIWTTSLNTGEEEKE